MALSAPSPRAALLKRFLGPCRRSSGVEHTLGKGGAGSSILPGGTIIFRINPDVFEQYRAHYSRPIASS